jgi:hypothetical protein
MLRLPDSHETLLRLFRQAEDYLKHLLEELSFLRSLPDQMPEQDPAPSLQPNPLLIAIEGFQHRPPLPMLESPWMDDPRFKNLREDANLQRIMMHGVPDLLQEHLYGEMIDRLKADIAEREATAGRAGRDSAASLDDDLDTLRDNAIRSTGCKIAAVQELINQILNESQDKSDEPSIRVNRPKLIVYVGAEPFSLKNDAAAAFIQTVIDKGGHLVTFSEMKERDIALVGGNQTRIYNNLPTVIRGWIERQRGKGYRWKRSQG